MSFYGEPVGWERRESTFLKCLVKNLSTSIVRFCYVQTVFWDVMPSGLQTHNFLHSKDLRTSKPKKKSLTAAQKDPP